MVDAATTRDAGHATDRFTALVASGDVAGARAVVEQGGVPGWQAALWKGSLALLHGRFDHCEAQAERVSAAAASTGDEDLERLASLLFASLRREQERVAEAEVVLRSQLGRAPDDPLGRALLAAVLTDLGRDTEARGHLEVVASEALPEARWAGADAVAAAVVLADVCAVLEEPRHSGQLLDVLAPSASIMAVEANGATCPGSVSRAMGVLCHSLGRLDDADAHFSRATGQHRAAGAAVLLAHTLRQHSATLRARAEAGDWERGRELLSEALAVYRHLGIERQAAHSEAVLLRSMDDA